MCLPENTVEDCDAAGLWKCLPKIMDDCAVARPWNYVFPLKTCTTGLWNNYVFQIILWKVVVLLGVGISTASCKFENVHSSIRLSDENERTEKSAWELNLLTIFSNSFSKDSLLQYISFFSVLLIHFRSLDN